MVQIEEIRNAFVGRLRKALAAKNIQGWGEGARLAKIAGVTPKASSKWLSGETMPGPAKMLSLANALSVRVEWLEYGRGEMLEGAQQPIATIPDLRTPPRDFDLKTSREYSGVTQLSAQGSTGHGEENPHVEIRGVLAFKSDWLRSNRLNPDKLDVIYAKGHSMEPTINDGDVLLVDESKIEPKDGQVFAMFSQAKGTIVKRLVKSDFNGWIIRSDNPDKANHGDQVLSDEEINEVRIIGRVVWRGGML